MRRMIVASLVLGLALAGCAAPRPDSPQAETRSPAASPSPAANGPSPSPPGPLQPCAGKGWPPFALGGVPGLSVMALDRANLVIRNDTDRTWHYRIAGWEAARFETCEGLAQHEVERGPIRPGEEIRTTLGHLLGRDVPITVAFWRERCGEACREEPVAGVLLVPSPLEPPSS